MEQKVGLTPEQDQRARDEARSMAKDFAREKAREEHERIMGLVEQGTLLRHLERQFEEENYPRYLGHCREHARKKRG